MIMVQSTFNLVPESRDEVLELMVEMEHESRKEPGCISYEYFTGITDPCQVVLVQEWESAAHLQLHYQTPHMEKFIGALGEYISEPVATRSYATPDEVERGAENDLQSESAPKTVH